MSAWTSIPVERMSEDEKDKLLNMVGVGWARGRGGRGMRGDSVLRGVREPRMVGRFGGWVGGARCAPGVVRGAGSAAHLATTQPSSLPPCCPFSSRGANTQHRPNYPPHPLSLSPGSMRATSLAPSLPPSPRYRSTCWLSTWWGRRTPWSASARRCAARGAASRTPGGPTRRCCSWGQQVGRGGGWGCGRERGAGAVQHTVQDHAAGSSR